MGVSQLWTEALGLFKRKPHEDLSQSKGMTLGIDIEIFLNKCNGRECTQLATTNVPTYPSPEILEWIRRHHNLFIVAGITPIYVFGGKAPRVKRLEKARRQDLRDKGGKEYSETLACFADGSNSIISDDDLELVVDSRKKCAILPYMTMHLLFHG